MLIKEIVLEGKDHMQEILEYDSVFQFDIDDYTTYIFCGEDNFL